MENNVSSNSRMLKWQPGLAKQIASVILYPIIFLVNRPSLQWFGNAIFDFALRCNGLAISFRGTEGLTASEERFLRKHLGGRTKGTFFDVGANSGSYSRFLAKLVPSAKIYAFEPHPTTFRSMLDEGLPPAITPLHLALSDETGVLNLYDFASDDGSTQASLRREAVELFTDSIVAHSVDVSTLDDFLDANGIDYVDLLKIDTEGNDLKVLKGAKRALAQNRIGTIQFEFIAANIVSGVRMRDFIELLEHHVIYRMCLNGALLPLTPYDVKRVEIFVVQNLIAVPKSPAHRQTSAVRDR